MDQNPKRRLGKYLMRRKLGTGGMGVVYEAEDVTLGRRVAVKILPRRLAAEPETLKRFHAEARAVARVNHPNIVQIHEVAEIEGLHCLVMELLAGGSAADRVRKAGAVPWQEATRLIADACRGLVAAHAAGMLHRDIKPGNLLLTGDGGAKLADFGLAKFNESTGASLTPKGSIVGTPDFMSPEQCRGESLDGRSDVYSLGAAYFTLLIGRPPFDGGNPVQTLYAHCAAPVPDPHEIDEKVPICCAAVVGRALAKNKDERYANAAEMLTDLEAILADPDAAALDPDAALPMTVRLGPSRHVPTARQEPTKRRRRPYILALAALLLAAAAISTIALLSKSDDDRPSDVPTKPPPPIRLRFRSMLTGHAGEVRTLRISRDGTMLASASADGTIRLWELPDGTPRHVLRGHKDKALCVAFTPDGGTLYSGSDDKTVRVWDVKTGKERPDPAWTGETVYDLDSTPDGKLLASAIGYAGFAVREMDRKTVLHAHPARDLLTVALFSPDGSTIAVAESRKSVQLRDSRSGRELGRLPMTEDVPSLAFSPDGTRLAVGTRAGKLRVCRPRDSEVETLTERGEHVNAVVWTPDGGSVIHTGNSQSRIVVHHLSSRRETEHREPRATAQFRSMALSPNGRLLAVGDNVQGVIQLWDVEEDVP